MGKRLVCLYQLMTGKIQNENDEVKRKQYYPDNFF